MQLYRQMGCLRDDLALHERALDILIELLKKEQVCVLFFSASKYGSDAASEVGAALCFSVG